MSPALRNSLKRTQSAVPSQSEAEDELAQVPKQSRVTPRNSSNGQVIREEQETPYANLRQLAGVIQKPVTLLEPSNLGTRPIRGTTGLLLSPQTRTPQAKRTSRTLLGRGVAPTTPHAIRALQRRRAAALIPGHDRRKSGRLQRETPRDALRNLSKILARTTQPIAPSPQNSHGPNPRHRDPEGDELDSEPDLPKPRLSMPIDQDEDDDNFHVPAPRFSLPVYDDNISQGSVELARRAISRNIGQRFSRESFGSARNSERFTDIDELGADALFSTATENSVLPHEIRDTQEIYGDIRDMEEYNEITQDWRLANFQDSSRRGSRPSDFQTGHLPIDEDNITFEFNIGPESSREPPSPEVESDLEAESIRVSTCEMRDNVSIDAPRKASLSHKRVAKAQNISRHGIAYHSLPGGVVKKLAATFASPLGNVRGKIDREALAGLMQASDWFFEQVGDDLGAYAKHAGRKTIAESDGIMLMTRQRRLGSNVTPFSLAHRYLSRELLQDFPTDSRSRTRVSKSKDIEAVHEEDNG